MSKERTKDREALEAIVRRLTETLRNEDGQKTQVHRQQAAELLGEIVSASGNLPGAEDEIINATGDDDQWVRYSAIQTLAPLASGSVKARGALIRVVSEGSPPDRRDVMRWLAPLAADFSDVRDAMLAFTDKYPGEAEDQIINALTLSVTENEKVLCFMLKMAGEQGTGQVLAIRALGRVLEKDREGEERERVVCTLLKCLWSPLGEVRRVARETLDPLKEQEDRIRYVLDAMPE